MTVTRPSALTLLPLYLTVTLTVLFAALALPVTHADRGAIRILETRQQVNFPDGVRLTLTAESDADIVEVKVYFRAVSSGIWSYAYADFEAGSRVVATISIPESETVYLPPGVDVEYYYRIRDARGAVLNTERAAMEYLDDRFDWRRVSIGPLELLYHNLDDGRVAGAARDISKDLGRVSDLLQLQPRGGFKGVIYNSYADANAVFPVQSQTTTSRGTFAGYAFPEQGVFVGQGLDRRIIVHESAHLLFRDALGEKALDTPAWLDEGFATYNEPNVQIRSSRSLYDRTPPLRAMNSLSGTPETIPLFYYKSASVVAYLIEEHGQDNFRRFLGELRRGRVIDDALLDVYGFGVNGLDDRWAGLSAQSAPFPSQQLRDEPSPFVFLDVWVLAGVALVSVAAVGFRFVYTRLRRNSGDNYNDPADWDDS